jgi:hypothetical protein
MAERDDGYTLAPPPRRWVCVMCGKTSPNRYGFDRQGKNIADARWDESCMLHAVLCEPISDAERPSGHRRERGP